MLIPVHMLFNIILQLVAKSLSEEFLFPLPTSLPIRLDICYALIDHPRDRAGAVSGDSHSEEAWRLSLSVGGPAFFPLPYSSGQDGVQGQLESQPF